MRWVKFVLSLISALALIVALSIPIGPVAFPVGDFLNPWQGIWQSGEAARAQLAESMDIEGLLAPATVVIDERGVPHIFAQSEQDLFFLQGYLTARDRLWQMDFQTRVAAGRLSEIVPVESEQLALQRDREFRRLGMGIAAERLEAFTMSNPDTRTIMEAYANGVNAYINSLEPQDYPIEYKLLNYAPEPWTPLKTAFLQKYMAYDLAARADDIEHTRALQLWGKEIVDLLYPQQPYDPSPIVPLGTRFRRPSLPELTVPTAYAPDSILLPSYTPQQPEPNLGSNNWVISGIKSATGKPMLANDPHLGLNLPSIWYEIQLNAPGINVYGVTLPGAPSVVIGFNDSIAWGVTNASRDVLDYYRIEYQDQSRQYYRHGDTWKPTERRIETYELKSGDTFVDTLIVTDIGPVMLDESFGDSPVPLAVRWMAHQPSNELATFYGINKAHNFTAFSKALEYYVCPAQNFAFACKNGDIAIQQQGRFANLWPDQGRFVLDGSNPAHIWNTFIPTEENPLILNRLRGYSSSANQQPTDDAYPYYYGGSFEQYRNRRINELLETTDSIDVADMKRFQLDNYAVMASEILPVLLTELDTTDLSLLERRCRSLLRDWDYMYAAESAVPAIYQAWWDSLNVSIWTDEFQAAGVSLDVPSIGATLRLLRDSAEFRFFDRIDTPSRENRKSLVNTAFRKAVAALEQSAGSEPEDWHWSAIRNTKIRHLLRMPAFSRDTINAGGYKNILNALSRTNGPSWRMVVSLTDEIEAYGVYPGGQSGDPGNPHYDNFIDTWEAGEYFELWLMKGPEDRRKPILLNQQLSPRVAP